MTPHFVQTVGFSPIIYYFCCTFFFLYKFFFPHFFFQIFFFFFTIFFFKTMFTIFAIFKNVKKNQLKIGNKILRASWPLTTSQGKCPEEKTLLGFRERRPCWVAGKEDHVAFRGKKTLLRFGERRPCWVGKEDHVEHNNFDCLSPLPPSITYTFNSRAHITYMWEFPPPGFVRYTNTRLY